MTLEGSAMGTPDFMAPEQARDSHGVDIRADLYSLGCTLYFLVGGDVPFPVGSITEKLFKHALEEPRSLEEMRPGTPPAVIAVVRRLMAKRPDDRYQTPAEAAAVLGAVAAADDWVLELDAASTMKAVSPFAGLTTTDVVPPQAAHPARTCRQMSWIGAAVAAAVVVVLAASAAVVWSFLSAH